MPLVIMAYMKSSKTFPCGTVGMTFLDYPPNLTADKPFATLDALYKRIFSSVEDDVLAQQILGFMGHSTNRGMTVWEITPAKIFRLSVASEQFGQRIPHSPKSCGLSSARLARVNRSKFGMPQFLIFCWRRARSEEFFIDIPNGP